MKKVLKFELISNIKYLLTAFGILIAIFIISSIQTYRDALKYSFLKEYTPVNHVCTITIFFIIFIVGLNFSYNKKQGKADLYYSLPISKKNLFLGKYFASVIEIAIFVFILYFIGFIGIELIEIRYSLGNYLLVMLLCMFACVAAFNYILLFYYLGNNYLDGIFYVVFGVLIPLIIISLLSYYIRINDLYLNLSFFFGFYNLTNMLPNMIYYENFDLIRYDTISLIYIIIGFIVNFLSIFIVYIISKNDSSDRTERVGYLHKYFIPIFYVSYVSIVRAMLVFTSFVMSFIIYTALYYVISVYFNRSLKIPKNEIIVFIASSIAGIILNLIGR